VLDPSHSEVATVGGDDQAVALESLQVQERGPLFDRLDERQLHVRPVHQSVCDDVAGVRGCRSSCSSVSSLRRITAAKRSRASRNFCRSSSTPTW
jgi:hypothetical protein